MVTRILTPVRILRPEFITGGCVLDLKMDEGEGVVVRDSSGYGNHGDLRPGPAPNYPGWVDGYYGKALSFDGVDDWVKVPHAPSLAIQEGTVELWIYPISHKVGWNRIIEKGRYDAQGYRIIQHTDPPFRLDAHIYDKAGITKETPWTEFPLNQWSFLTMVFRKGFLGLYKNAELVTKRTDNITGAVTGTSDLMIGSDFGGNENTNVIIDEVRIYNRALTSKEIKAHFLEARAPKVRKLALVLLAYAALMGIWVAGRRKR